ncbi:MAG: hypothetical protein Tp1111DCM1126091_26 [Prokaryotic dsDNA virus sp.]|nr:MAG: hypothetical protein Tp1111DCM1126091_26 [Prokaryotic dsDNA virus sp.]|tara:strand:- start:3059 stop:3304 length:246 start_codon:yes stop_codon:yes gene_type:complete
MLKRIHINQHNIRYNAKADKGTELKPVVSVKTSKGNYKGMTTDILGDSKVVYSESKPLSCGAKVWIETRAVVVLDGILEIN